MAIRYVGGIVGSRSGNSNDTTLQSLTALTGGINTQPAADDLVIVVCVVGSQGRNTSQAISGYSTLGTQLNPTAVTYDTSLQVSYKKMTATPDTQITIPAQGANTDGQAWAVMVFRGVDTATPFDVTSTSNTGTGTGRFTPPAISPSTSGAWIVVAGGGAAAAGASYTAPAEIDVARSTSGSDTNDGMAGIGYDSSWSSGTYTPSQWTGGTTGANDSWAAWTMALRPQSTQTYSYTATGGYTFGGAATAGRARAATGSGGLTFGGTAAELRLVDKTASGGLSFAGAATVSFQTPTQTYEYAATGGYTFGGAATESAARAATGSGGLTFGGTAAELRLVDKTASGGLSFAGAATVSFQTPTQTYEYTAQGGFAFSGAAGQLRHAAVAADGGFSFSGAAGQLRTAAIAAAGGLVLGGTAEQSRQSVATPSGGISLSGAAVQTRQHAAAAAGGYAFGGASGFTFARAVTPSGGLSLSGQADITQHRIVAVAGGIGFGGAASVVPIDSTATSSGRRWYRLGLGV